MPTNRSKNLRSEISESDSEKSAVSFGPSNSLPMQVSTQFAAQIVDDWLDWIRGEGSPSEMMGSSAGVDDGSAGQRSRKERAKSFDLNQFDPEMLLAVGFELCSSGVATGDEQSNVEQNNLRRDRVSQFRDSINANNFARAETLLRNYVLALQTHIASGEEYAPIMVTVAANIYEAWYGSLLGPAVLRPIAAMEGPLLQCISWARRRVDLEKLADLLVSKPPSSWMPTAVGISPLMRSGEWDVTAIFPKLLVGLQNPSTAAPVLDLANYCMHSNRVSEHPAKVKQDSLVAILGGVISRLALAEEDPTSLGNNAEEIQGVLSDSVALAVSLCDAVGLMGATNASGKLHQALELQHRRVQTEAAAALMRIGEEVGKKALIALAAEPVARLRVLRYAEELGIESEIEESQTMPLAVAESELALWLSEPQQFGLPPHALELLDVRTLSWPGYEEPQQCYLFRYTYRLPQGEISNIGIAGPLAHTFGCDLADLPIPDIYAMFAGWHAEHEEIFEVAAEQWNSAQKRVASQLIKILEENKHESIEPLWLGFFLSEIAVIARTRVENSIGFVVSDGAEILWYPSSGRLRPLGPNEVYSLYKGRKILKSFNGHDVFESDDAE